MGWVTVGVIDDDRPTGRFTEVGVTEIDVMEVGSACTVMAMVPSTPPDVAVIVAVPTATAVTRPVALTVAIDEFEVLHTMARPVSTPPLESRTVAVSCCVLPGMIDAVPGVICTSATAGATVTVTNSVAVAAEKLVLPGAVAVTVIVAVPIATAVTTPPADTVAIAGSAVP